MSSLLVENWKASFYIIPLLITYLVYRFEYRRRHDRKRAIHRSMAFSTLLYMMGTLYLIHAFFDSYFIGYILIGLIVFLGLILIMQWKYNNEVVLIKGVKILWRFCFLLFFTSYLSLLIYNLGQFIYKTFIS